MTLYLGWSSVPLRQTRSLDATDPDFINGFLVSHNVFPPKELRVCERFPLTREWRKTPKPGRGRKAPTAPVTGRADKSKAE